MNLILATPGPSNVSNKISLQMWKIKKFYKEKFLSLHFTLRKNQEFG